MLLYWIIIIIIFVSIVKKEKQKQEIQNKKLDKQFEVQRTKYPNNSYYSKQKIEQYKNQERNHQGHEDTSDITSTIGYKRCPQCENLINKKSETCFMCNYNFKENEKDL